MGNPSKEKTVKKKAFEISKQAQVLVFDESKYGIRKKAPGPNRAGSKREHEDVVASAPEDADEYINALSSPPPLTFRSSVADMEVNEIWEKLKDTVDDIRTEKHRWLMTFNSTSCV